MTSPPPSRLVGYLAAVGSVTLAVAATYAIHDWIEPSSSLLFFPAVVIAMYGGYGPALVATLLSTAALAYFFVPPRNSFSIGIDDAVRLSVFALVAFATAWLSAARKRAEDAEAEIGGRAARGGVHVAQRQRLAGLERRRFGDGRQDHAGARRRRRFCRSRRGHVGV